MRDIKRKLSVRDIPAGDPRFAITNHKGTQFTFKNGICISIQWGPYNYCADYFDFEGLPAHVRPAHAEFWESPDAEIAILYAGVGVGRVGGKGQEWLTRDAYAALNNGEDCGDDVLPRITPDEVTRYIAWAVAHPGREKP